MLVLLPSKVGELASQCENLFISLGPLVATAMSAKTISAGGGGGSGGSGDSSSMAMRFVLFGPTGAERMASRTSAVELATLDSRDISVAVS